MYRIAVASAFAILTLISCDNGEVLEFNIREDRVATTAPPPGERDPYWYMEEYLNRRVRVVGVLHSVGDSVILYADDAAVVENWPLLKLSDLGEGWFELPEGPCEGELVEAIGRLEKDPIAFVRLGQVERVALIEGGTPCY